MDRPLHLPERYGADAFGLVCGYRFTPGDQALSIDSDGAAGWLGGGGAEDAHAFVWLHFNLAHAGAERGLQRHAALPDAFFDALHDGRHSTRIERDEAALVAVINDVHFDFSFESSDIATLWIAVDRRLVVTARRSPLRSVDRLRTAIKRGEAMRSTAELLERLLRAQAAVLVDVVRGVTGRIDDLEDDLRAGQLDHKRTRLGVLRRLLVRLQRVLAHEPAALFRLLQRPPLWISERDVDDLREASEEFSVALRNMSVAPGHPKQLTRPLGGSGPRDAGERGGCFISALQERIQLLQEEIVAAVGEGTGRSLFVLTVVTVLALPINILAGLFGMHVGGIPLAENPYGFWLLLAAVAVFTLAAGGLAFGRRRDR